MADWRATLRLISRVLRTGDAPEKKDDGGVFTAWRSAPVCGCPVFRGTSSIGATPGAAVATAAAGLRRDRGRSCGRRCGRGRSC